LLAIFVLLSELTPYDLTPQSVGIIHLSAQR
jgi:hypothetical protein